MIIPRKVEEKIRYLLRKYPSTEWSGVLFFSHTGTFEDNNLIITCEDLYPMDLGNSTFTKFQMSEDVTGYMADNIELFECDLGLIHSHHSMAAFFSGTDTTTLQEEGNERNCFVSLIVNNAGTYCAAVTRKMQSSIEVITKSLGTSYEFFGDGAVKTDEDPMSEATRVIDKEVIEYFMLDIEKEEVPNHLAWLDTRFDEILKKKDAQRPITSNSSSGWLDRNLDWGNKNVDKDDEFFDWLHSNRKTSAEAKEALYDSSEGYKVKNTPKELSIWDDKTMNEMEEPMYAPDPTKIHAMVTHLVLCSLIVDPTKTDLKQWISRHMKKKYDEMFTQDMSFDAWCEFAIEYLFTEYSDPEAPARFYLETDELYAILAEYMIDELTSYPNNEYIDLYINVLNRYLDYA